MGWGWRGQLLINKQILLSRNEVGEREGERGKIKKKVRTLQLENLVTYFLSAFFNAL